MDAQSTEKKREIVKLVFPDLRYGGDPDIDRYFELRKVGKLTHALAVYDGALRVRYPDDGSRVLLLKLYRENDPRYASYQDGLVLDFAAKLSLRIRSNIDLIIAPLEKADLSDAMRALKAVESVLSRLPGEVEGALGLLTRYDRFAQVLGHREVLVRRALDLVREYDAVSRADSPSEYDFIARSAAIEDRRRASSRPSGSAAAARRGEEGFDFVSRSASLESRRKSAEKKEHSYFDPARIKFSDADRARVEISPALSRREDRVLAFCAKYWSSARDEAFERIVFLYSRKFGVKHFEVFRAIKMGRGRGSTDDEILSAVAAILTTSYSYSVSGDLYMQIMWRRYRARMQAQAVAERLSAPGPEAKVRARRLPAAHAATPAAAPHKAAARPPQAAAALVAPSKSGHIVATPLLREAAPVPAASEKASTFKPVAKQHGEKLLGRRPAPEPIREIGARRGSISDSIRKLSGRTYDVYKIIFLEKVRDHIHRGLLSSQSRSHGLFDSAANEAEDQVFGFISAHYDDPFMDWEHSAERNVVEALGFSMPSLAPIIESCFKKL